MISSGLTQESESWKELERAGQILEKMCERVDGYLMIAFEWMQMLILASFGHNGYILVKGKHSRQPMKGNLNSREGKGCFKIQTFG